MERRTPLLDRDVSTLPLEVRMELMESTCARVGGELQRRFPEHEGYVHERPVRLIEDFLVIQIFEVTRGPSWGVRASVAVDTHHPGTRGDTLRVGVSPAVPGREKRQDRNKLVAGLVAVAFAVWMFLNLGGEVRSVREALLLTAFAAAAVGVVTFGLLQLVAPPGVAPRSLEETALELAAAFDLSGPAEVGDIEVYELDE